MPEPKQGQIKLFIDDKEVRHFDKETVLKEIAALLLDGEEGFLFLDDSEEPLDLAITLDEVGIKKHGHIHANRCRQVDVTVEYAGQSKSRKFPPTAKVKVVKEWAVRQDWEPPIDPAERPKFALFLPETDSEALSEASRIGIYLTKGKCSLTLELAYQERQQG
ncbi:MAG: hypothetical protein VKJ04_05265 [Vampirovibrionales bacterium]|nr:hypothetical protein [Vampirovibrionales bacterium]